MEQDKFILVTRKHKKYISRKMATRTATAQLSNDCSFDISQQQLPCLSGRIDVRKSIFYQKLLTELRKIIGCKTVSIVCYGLGSVAKNCIARIQLAVLCNLIADFDGQVCDVCAYDPKWTAEETELLSSKSINVPSNNDLCLHSVSSESDAITLFYMPHCGRPMYNNLLFANWSAPQLSKVVIVGNSFESIQQQLASTNSAAVQNELRYLIESVQLRLSDEVQLPKYEPNADAFNDTAIITFMQSTAKMPPRGLLPKYLHIDNEILL